MSRIEDLIQQLCPEGVRFPPLGQFINIIRGQRVTKRDLIDQGVPVVSGGVGYMGFVSKSNREANTITMAQYGAAGYVKWQTEPFWANDVCFSLIPKDSQLNYRYLYYFLKDKQELLFGLSNRNAIPYSIDAKKVLDLKIPAPPLEIQKEIASILDKFTQLEAQLEAELEARKTQYEVTRDRLLDFSGDLSAHPMGEKIRELCPGGVKVYSLGDLIEENLGGGTPSRSQPNFWGGEIAWASVGDLTFSELELRTARQSITQEGLQSSSTNLIPEGWVVAAVKIAPGEMRVVKSPVAINQDLRGLRLKSSLDPRFLVFYSKTLQVRSNGTIVKGITNESLKKIPIPLPPLLIQKEIISILEKLDDLVNDISYGLPAEIVARRKQYEYYRNKLLTFKEMDAA